MSRIYHKKLRLSVYIIGSKSFSFARHKVLAVTLLLNPRMANLSNLIRYQSDTIL